MLTRRIHAKAPIRICDVGGWTDTWFARHGRVFHMAAAPYVEVDISLGEATSRERVRLHLENYAHHYSLDPDRITHGEHPLIEAVLSSFRIPEEQALEIGIFSRAPSGASVGSSASVCVALAGALDALTPGRMTPHEVARLAHGIETGKLGLQSGIQDQYAAACGGINLIEMESYPLAEVTRLEVEDHVLWELEDRLALVYIGKPHSSSEVHEKVIADLGDDASSDPRLEALRSLAAEAAEAVSSGELEVLGSVMDRCTEAQRALHPDLVCDRFDRVMEIARAHGARGCKVNGAGGDGGSVTVLGDGDGARKRTLIQTLEQSGFHSIPVSLSPHGLRVWSRPWGQHE